MRTEQQYFEDALPLEKYMAQMEVHQEKSYQVYERFELPEDEAFFDLLREKQPHVLAITEDWCGDAMMNNPILRKVAERADLEIRCVYRDQNLELMDRYLTNGGRSIPKYIILSSTGEVLGTWGPRAPQIQEFVMTEKAKLPDPDDARFELQQKAFHSDLTERFASSEEFWQLVYEDLRNTFREALK
ncbi:thioredoxin family protein [Planococcus lenghuensis]|uniref:Thioredoxin family protein n=1 Tax=Planococcus lenghuensis TaxID=2213202 RepID=A0A1Q2KW81_9BACL|nr:thioredoxin family protein [Planococcus lenghuensis]AQQ52451.1 thioredoxin family protein [Planococcus lenghuensis]